MSSGIQAFNEGYVKTVWQTGDVITAEKLNNMENGIENITEYATTNYIYCVTGDYDDGDTIYDEDYERIASNVYENAGVVFINIVPADAAPFTAVISKSGILPITPVDYDYSITISDTSPHTLSVSISTPQ